MVLLPIPPRHLRPIQTRRLKLAKLAAAMKLPPPKKWDGNPSIDTFEEWLFEMTEYYKNYMSIVAPTMENWTFDKVATLFFDELFPANIREILRNRFEKSQQGTLSVKAWAQRVKDLAARITDVSPEALARRFWRGARGHIRIELAGLGYSEEFSKFEELEEAGYQTGVCLCPHKRRAWPATTEPRRKRTA